MKVYLLKADHRYQGLVPEDDPKGLDRIRGFDGKRFGESWDPLRVEVNPEDPSEIPIGDFVSFFSHIPVFSTCAVDVLSKLLFDNGEILRLNCDRGKYFALNVTTLVKALDLDQSDIVRFTSGRIMNVRRYSLVWERVENRSIFKLPEVPLLDVFVTDVFVEVVTRNKLTGFRFEAI